MNNLEYKKEQVRYWSKVISLLLVGLPLLIKYYRNEKTSPEFANQPLIKVLDSLVWLLVLLLAVITYFTSYYTISSLSWPEPLSTFNHLLLVPCIVWTGANIWDTGTLLMKKLK